MRGSVRKTILWVTIGTIELLLIIAVVADLGGENLKDWVRPGAMKAVGKHWDQGSWGLAMGHLIDGVTIGGYTAGILWVLCALFLIRAVLQWKQSPEPLSRKDVGDGPGPTADMTAVPFRRLRVGGVDEFVGREEAMAWLGENLIEKPVNSVAVASMHGAGGMGKTFLAHVFAAEHRGEIPFLEIHLGERSALEAGIELLEKLDVDVRGINTPEKLRVALHRLYSRSGGILILDDVRDEEARILLPETIKWRALITSRSRTLAEKLTPKVRPLESLRPPESMALFRNVLGGDFAPGWKKDYQELADFLAHRPYGIRLAAESMKSGLVHTSPRDLLDALASRDASPHTPAAGSARTLESLWPLLDHCLTQLESRSPFARELLDALAVCSEDGMELPFFLEWQGENSSPDQVEHELTLARDLGLLLVEAPVSTQMTGEKSEPRIRLHTDLLNLLRRSPLSEQIKALHRHLRLTLVENPENMEHKRPLQKQIMSLHAFYHENPDELISFYFDFWEHLYRTGRLNWAHEIGESARLAVEKQDKLDIFRAIIGTQALILKAWGKLEEAMDLHKKEEEICRQLDDRAGLAASYGNQALILQDWGKLEEAMDLHKKEEEIKKQLGDRAGLARSYGNQALILQAWGKLEEAMDLHKKEEEIKKQLGNRAGLARSYGNQGLILQAWGKLEEAMDLHKKEEEIKKQLGDRAGLVNCYWNTGVLLRKMGRHEMALDKLKAAIQIEEELNLPRLDQFRKQLADYMEELDGRG